MTPFSSRAVRAALMLALVLGMLLTPGGPIEAAAPSALRTPQARGTPAASRAQLAAGQDHTCALLPDGKVRCWGANASGQLGNGTTTTSWTPVIVGGGTPLTSVVGISVGEHSSCALIGDGTARCWGEGSNGQLGHGVTSDSSAPVTVGGATPLTGIVSIAIGDTHGCAVLGDGTARCWGLNDFGQIGDNSNNQRLTPTTVGGATPLTNAVSISAGRDYTCAVLSDGTARCWGRGGSGQLGFGSTNNRLLPSVVGGAGTPLTGVVSISPTSQHTCALLIDGTARCWGNNFNGQLGDGTSGTMTTLPVVVGGATPITGIIAIEAGAGFTCLLRTSGVAECIGYNGSGQLGDGTTTTRATFAAVSGLSNIVAIAAYEFHSCALLADGTARCWGANGYGQLGDGTTDQRLTPAMVAVLAGQPSGTVDVALGQTHSCALVGGGGSRCWGSGGSGQIGDGATSQRLSPTTVGGTTPLTSAVMLASGLNHTCAVIADGTARCWGSNSNSQLGDGTTTNATTPVAMGGAAPIADIATIAAGNSHTCFALTDGTARCVGNAANGRLGDGSTTGTITTPVTIGGATPLTQVVGLSLASLWSCARLADGTARCWGNNDTHQLGDGTSTTRPLPVTVGGATPLTGIVALDTGANHACAVLADGTARCWGSNNNGQLGDGTTIGSATPVVVGDTTPLTTILAISAGAAHTCATLADGTARCWGLNANYQLGDGTTTSSSTPVVVGGATPLTDLVAISTGANHSCAVKASGHAYCWGSNASGQIGIGSLSPTFQTTPTRAHLAPLPTLSITDAASVTEGHSGNSSMVFTVTLSAASIDDVSVSFATGGGTATGNNDYTTFSGLLTIPAGQTSKTIAVEVRGDAIYENDEALTVTLSNPSEATLADASATGTILNDDPLPTITLGSPSVQEGNAGNTTLSFTATLSHLSQNSIMVNYATSNGTALAGLDYNSQANTLTFGGFQTSAFININVVGDTLYEADETLRVTLSNPSGATLATTIATGTIINDDAIPSVSISGGSVLEGNAGTTSLVFTITLSAASGTSTAITMTTEDGTALTPSDYNAINGTIFFSPGQTTRNITVTVKGDTLYENDETLTVALSDPSGATLATTIATGTIINDDAIPSVSISGGSVQEGTSGTSSLVYTATLSAASGTTATVQYATSNDSASAGSDYVAQSGTLTFAPGQATRTVSITVNGDTLYENDETLTVLLSSPSGVTLSTSSATGTILNDDAMPSLTITGGSVAEGNSGTHSLNFTITLSAASALPTSVEVATLNGTASAGSDYMALGGTMFINPGQLSRTITVTINSDTLYEGDETLSAVLSNPSNASIATSSATGTIFNDDAAPSITLTGGSGLEGDSGTRTIFFTATLSAASSFPATVSYATQNGSASSTSDYAASSGTLAFAPGQTTKTITVTVNGDTLYEADETLSVLLSSPSGATIDLASATGTITNDDGMTSMLIEGGSVVEGNSGTSSLVFTVTLESASGLPVSVNYATSNGSATAGSDYTAISGTLTFAPGEDMKTITVTVSGDTLYEANETLSVTLSNPNGATIDLATATGTITNDDGQPALSIVGGSVLEGASGTSSLVFTVTLGAASGLTTTVSFATTAGTALADSDYTAQSGALTFAPGESTKTISVQILGDEEVELDETLSITLSNAVGASISTASATGMILNDDAGFQLFMPLMHR